MGHQLKMFTAIYVTAKTFEVGGDASAAYGVIDKTKKKQKVKGSGFNYPFNKNYLLKRNYAYVYE